MLSVTNNTIILDVVMLSVVMLNAVALFFRGTGIAFNDLTFLLISPVGLTPPPPHFPYFCQFEVPLPSPLGPTLQTFLQQ
jgi:hypothetical protein